jgi:asparagine synthase (glutamine-hydrolysing)
MCGITGVIDLKNQKAVQFIAAMTRTVQHRGPDDEGFACFRLDGDEIQIARGDDTAAELSALPHISTLRDMPCEVVLGHRRLSIIDLSVAGHNPLSNHDQRLWITYNGEVYNYLELRAELAELGHHFQSGTDTEVILAAYDQWGTDCLWHFNGMFAFALWDRREKRLFCARDRFGVKPFYYFHQDHYFAFASEIKGLLANPHVPCCANPQAIHDYLVNGAMVSVEGTFFEEIHQLPGSHALTLNADGKLRVWRYFDIDYESHFSGNHYEDRVAEFRELLTDAVRLHLRSDVPVGSSLSGGLDSSSVVTLANRLLQSESGIKREVIGERQRVFCAIYDGETFNEKPHMDTVIAHTGAAAYFTRPSSKHLWEELHKLVWHQDEPVNATAIFAQYCVMQLVRQNAVTVLLDGQGGDEVLAGYPFYYGYYLAQALHARRPDRFMSELRGARSVANVPWASLLSLTGWNLSPAWLRSLGWRLGGAKLLSHKPISSALVNAEFHQRHDQGARIKHNAYPTLAQKLYDDVFNTNLPALLRYEDRNSMAFHIEARVPFLDYRLVQFAFKLSADAHIRNGWSKAILRDSMAGLLPDSIRLRRDKEGYTTPHNRWMCELTPQINGLFGGQVRSEPYLSSEAITQLRSPSAGEIPGVWRLINLESWLRAFNLA